jgi:hypothetical protein
MKKNETRDTMQRPTKITAIVGTYRKGGVIDSAVDELLGAAAAAGAQTTKFYLVDERTKRAVVVASSAAPAILGRLFTSMVGLLKQAARLLGAQRVDVLFIGLAALKERPDIGDKARRKAQRLGRKLAEHQCR